MIREPLAAEAAEPLGQKIKSYSVWCPIRSPISTKSRATVRVMSADDALRPFDAFMWYEQVKEANRLQKCSPTFSIRATDRLIWVSAYGESLVVAKSAL
jgi:hypothetical protein